MNKITERAAEPSTWGGIGALIYGLGEVFKINEVAQLAEAAGQAAQAAQSGSWVNAVTAFGIGALMAFMPERGGKK